MVLFLTERHIYKPNCSCRLPSGDGQSLLNDFCSLIKDIPPARHDGTCLQSQHSGDTCRGGPRLRPAWATMVTLPSTARTHFMHACGICMYLLECTHVLWKRMTSGIFLHHSLPCSLIQTDCLASSFSPSLKSWSYRCVLPCGPFQLGARDLNTDPHACTVSILSNQPWNW